MRKIIREYRLGDMQAYYISTEDQRQVELLLIPAGEKLTYPKWEIMVLILWYS